VTILRNHGRLAYRFAAEHFGSFKTVEVKMRRYWFCWLGLAEAGSTRCRTEAELLGRVGGSEVGLISLAGGIILNLTWILGRVVGRLPAANEEPRHKGLFFAAFVRGARGLGFHLKAWKVF
jgi:hypothetical protein